MDCGEVLNIFYKNKIPCGVFREAYIETNDSKPLFSYKVFDKYLEEKYNSMSMKRNKYESIESIFKDLFGNNDYVTVLKYFVFD